MFLPPLKQMWDPEMKGACTLRVRRCQNSGGAPLGRQKRLSRRPKPLAGRDTSCQPVKLQAPFGAIAWQRALDESSRGVWPRAKAGRRLLCGSVDNRFDEACLGFMLVSYCLWAVLS